MTTHGRTVKDNVILHRDENSENDQQK